MKWVSLQAWMQALSCVTGCGRALDDKAMEMLGGYGHCDAGWLLLWNHHLPTRSVARGRIVLDRVCFPAAIHTRTPTLTLTHIHTHQNMCKNFSYEHSISELWRLLLIHFSAALAEVILNISLEFLFHYVCVRWGCKYISSDIITLWSFSGTTQNSLYCYTSIFKDVRTITIPQLIGAWPIIWL